MNSWTSVASSLSFANWFSDDESLRVGGRPAGDARVAAGGGRRGRKAKSLLDSPDSFAVAAAAVTTTTVTPPPSSLLLLRLEATLPPIVVRSPGGKELDTDTSYQRSLRRARAKCLLGLPLSSSEWQLPHASAPSRPDYSRVVPPPPVAKFKRSPRPAGAIAAAAAEQLAIAGNSGHLEPGPVSPRLSKMQLAPLPPIRAAPQAAAATVGDVVYASFVACSVLHQRDGCSSLQHEDVRAVLTDYQFPGWCYGCRLLHERPPADAVAGDPSYNPFRDRPVRVGGGYAYVVRRPDSDAGARRDAAALAPPQASIAPPGPGGGGVPAAKRSQSAFDLRVIDRLPRIVDSVRGKHICLLRRRGAWLRDDQLQTDKLHGAPRKENDQIDLQCFSSRLSQPASATGTQKTFANSASAGSEKDDGTPMLQELLLRGENKGPGLAQDDIFRELEIASGHSTSSSRAPQMLTVTNSGSAEHSPFIETQTDCSSAIDPLQDSLDDCVSFVEKNTEVLKYSDLLQKQIEEETHFSKEDERTKSTPCIEEHLSSLQSSTFDVQCAATTVAANTGNNVAKLIADSSPEESEIPLGLHRTDKPKQSEEVTMDFLYEDDETLSLASPSAASKDESMESNLISVGAASEGSSSSNSGSSSSGGVGSHISVNSANRDSQTSGRNQRSRNDSHGNNGSGMPFAAVEVIQSENVVNERNFASEKMPASPSKVTVSAEAKEAGEEDVLSSAQETAVASSASDASVERVDEATPAAVVAQQNPGTADGISTGQRNLEQLLQSTVQVSSWKQDTATATVAAAPHYQEAQVLTPSIITIPTDQARTETHSVVTDFMADEAKSQSAGVLQTRDTQDMPTAVITTVDNVDRVVVEPSGSSTMSPQQDALKSVQSRSKSFLKPLRQPAGARHRKSVAAATAASKEFPEDIKEAKPVEEEAAQTKSHPATLERPSKISAADAAKESLEARKKPEMKTVARKKDKATLTKQAHDDDAVAQGSDVKTSPEQTSSLETTNMESVIANNKKIGGTATQRSPEEKTALRSTKQARSQARNEESLGAKNVASLPDQHDESNTGTAVTTKKATTAKKNPPPAPAEKPNFMHLLSIGTAPEDEPHDPSPIAQTPASPEMEFVIQREPTTPEPPESPRIPLQPVPSVEENAQVVEPPPLPPPPVVKKELLPPPQQIDVGPPPQVVRKRLRALKLFESRGRVVSLVQRRSEIASPTRRDLLRAGADPVDYLTKYCLIHSDRLPYYERVFREVVTHQQPRLESVTNLASVAGTTAAPDGPEQPQKKANEPTERQKKLLRLSAQLPAHAPRCREPAINAAEFQAARVQYTMERLQARYEQLVIAIEQLEQERNQALASAARVAYPEILAADYKPSSGKRKRSPKRKKRSPSPGKTPRASMLPDSQVLERLSASQRDNLTDGDKTIRGMTMRLERMEEQCVTAELRAAELEAEKEEMKNWAKELFARQQTNEKLTAEFRLSQAQFFNRLHPLEDLEMNLEELEYALQLINNHLITDKERKYIYHVLDIPGNTRINLKLFSCIAALSEKVHQLDPIVRKLINKLDYEALEIKMEACKEMFFLLADRSPHNGHHIQLSDLGVELAAGGLSADTVRYVIGRLDFMSTGQVEYLDFLMYIPLFLEIHQKIVKEPLGDRSPRRVSSVGK